MHALVPAVLLRLAGLNALDPNPQPQPPDRELAQGKRRREPITRLHIDVARHVFGLANTRVS
jgi:hypothetical protein